MGAEHPPAKTAQLLAAFRHKVRVRLARQVVCEQALSERRRSEAVLALRAAIRSARDPGLRGRVWLFGSFAWGTPAEHSDIDLFVEDQADEQTVAKVVAGYCNRMAHIVTAQNADAALVARIHRHGKLL